MTQNPCTHPFSSETQIFAFDDHLVRTLGTPEHPFFVAADVCQALGIRHHRSALRSLPAKAKGVQTLHSLGGPQQILVITEPGVYRLAIRSTKTTAVRFQDWIYEVVIPSLRKTGSYSLNGEDRLRQERLREEQLWLRSMVKYAKTGKNQLMMLQALGYAIPSASPATSTSLLRSSRSNPPQIEEWWRAVLATVKNQPHLRYHLRVVERLPDQSRLMILPGPLLTAVQMAVDSFKHYTAADIRSALQATREWVAGKHTVRMGVPGQMKLAKVWAFLVTNESNPDLQTLCTLEYPETN